MDPYPEHYLLRYILAFSSGSGQLLRRKRLPICYTHQDILLCIKTLIGTVIVIVVDPDLMDL
jgi:hypothetical protein